MKEINKKIKLTLHTNIYHIEGLSGDEQVQYRKLIDEILDSVEENYHKPRKVKRVIAKIIDDHVKI